MIPASGPFAGGNIVLVTNAPVIGNGEDIINVTVGVDEATITGQGANWVAFVMPASETSGLKDILILSSSVGFTILPEAYTVISLAVTIPNGAEVGRDAWLIGVPYTIQWISHDSVSDKLKLDYSLDSGQTWTLIATNVQNVAGTNNYSYWTTPGVVSSNCSVRIMDMLNDANTDVSDSAFSLVERFRVLVPNGGETWYTGRTNVVRWASALNLGLLTIDYAADGSNYDYNVVFGRPNTPGATTNVFMWATPTGMMPILSEAAKIRIRTIGGQGTDYSDYPFALAGLIITHPQVGTTAHRGESLNISWVSSGAGSTVAFDFTSDNGASWTNVVTTNSNSFGSNTSSWIVNANPTRLARIRIRSLSDTNLVAVSDSFVVGSSGAIADVDPSSGIHTGGYPVMITGTNFSNGADVTNVTLCGVSAMNIVSQSATQMVIIPGSARPGKGVVAVYSTSCGETIATNSFQYNPTLTVVKSDHGTVVPSGVVEVFYGGSTTFVATADAYCRIRQLLINSMNVSAASNQHSYVVTWANVTDTGVLTTAFAENRTTNTSTPEWWLASFGWTNDFEVAATNDNDNDGMNNWQEWVAGCDPTNSNSVFRFTSVDIAQDHGMVVSWPSISNRSYTVSRATDLRASTNAFTILSGASNMPATPAQNVYTDAVQGVGPYFYKIDVRE